MSNSSEPMKHTILQSFKKTVPEDDDRFLTTTYHQKEQSMGVNLEFSWSCLPNDAKALFVSGFVKAFVAIHSLASHLLFKEQTM